jgi:hypothetical protein
MGSILARPTDRKSYVCVKLSPVGIEPTTHGLKGRCSFLWASRCGCHNCGGFTDFGHIDNTAPCLYLCKFYICRAGLQAFGDKSVTNGDAPPLLQVPHLEAAKFLTAQTVIEKYRQNGDPSCP